MKWTGSVWGRLDRQLGGESLAGKKSSGYSLG